LEQLTRNRPERLFSKRKRTVRVTDGFKEINGKWLIAHTHFSVPVDLQKGKADIKSKP